jgi:hypothetical protein
MELERAIAEFYNINRGITLFSTGSRVVEYADVLYNVDGSTDDPQINGKSWKRLLQRNGINGDCYVTDPQPAEGSSHPGFNVGGHMTPNPRGYVESGGICYLMPLCNWHNSTQRNGIPFEHEETRMLELSGYMEADIAATFEARMPGEAEYRLVSVEDGAVISRDIDAPLLNKLNIHRDTGGVNPGLPQTYIRFRRVVEGGAVRFVIDDARLPILG